MTTTATPTSPTTPTTRRRRPSAWVPAALIALVAIPSIAGFMRLMELAGGHKNLPPKPYLTASPLPLIVHIVAAVSFAVIGALQFLPVWSRRRRAWHRIDGRAVVLLGVVVALTALWMNQLTPRDTLGAQLLYLFRFGAGTAMVLALVLGVTTIRRGDVRAHRAWMIRSYALAFGAATQVFTIGIGQALFGKSDDTNAFMNLAAWVINLGIAERTIRHERVTRRALDH